MEIKVHLFIVDSDYESAPRHFTEDVDNLAEYVNKMNRMLRNYFVGYGVIEEGDYQEVLGNATDEQIDKLLDEVR